MTRRIATALAMLSLVACAEVPKVAPTLKPVANGAVWPSPPQTARYAYAGTLTGENDFRPKGDEIKLDYLVKQSDKGWKIVDVFYMGGISEIANQRSQFLSILKNGGVEQLVRTLDDKAQQQAQAR